jgi:hypothetical protein
MKGFTRTATVLAALVLLALWSGAAMAALTAGETYTITAYQLNSDGTLTQFDVTTVEADGDGKISFTLTDPPTFPDTYLLYLEVNDSADVLVREGFVPAPAEGETNQMGINDLSTAQASAIKAAAETIGEDNPIALAFLLVMVRTSDVDDATATLLAQVGQGAILGDGGFEATLTDNGVSDSQIALLKQYLIRGADEDSKDIGAFVAKYKTAVDSDDANELYEAGGLMADIFLDAANGAGIDSSLILAAHDAAGYVVEEDPTVSAVWSSLGTDVTTSINQAMTAFFLRIESLRVKSEYTQALETLGASGTQVDTFLAAADDYIAGMEEIEQTFGQYYEDPEAFLAASSEYATDSEVQSAIDTAFTNLFTTFESAITATDAEITAMQEDIAAALNTTVESLGSDFGTYEDFDGQTVNWPITQVVLVNWYADILTSGGDLSYDRATVAASLPVPGGMTWLNGGTGTREDYTGQLMEEFLGIYEDVEIADYTRYAIYDNGEPTSTEEKQAKLDFVDNIELIQSAISGTSDGTTALSDAVIGAIVKLMQQPSVD